MIKSELVRRLAECDPHRTMLEVERTVKAEPRRNLGRHLPEPDGHVLSAGKIYTPT